MSGGTSGSCSSALCTAASSSSRLSPTSLDSANQRPTRAGTLRPVAAGPLGGLAPEAFLAVNASPELLGETSLAEMIAAAPNRRMVLEVTEHVEVADYDTLVDGLDILRTSGCRIAVDDAGAGYSSLRHILRLRPDYIKLDMTLTRGIDTDGDRRALASSLLTFAREVSATVIAEGIETPAELDTLRGLGATLGQGYLLARPCAATELFPA